MKEIVTMNDVTERILKVLNDEQGNKTEAQFAKELGLLPSTFSNYKVGRLPQLEQLIKIRNNLKMPFGYLLGEIDVTKYENDNENTFGLTKECIRKIETFSDDEIRSLNNLIIKCPKELIELLTGYFELPTIDNNVLNFPMDSDNKMITPSSFMHYRMQDEIIRKKINQRFNSLITSIKPSNDYIAYAFTERGKQIRTKLTPELYTFNEIFNEKK